VRNSSIKYLKSFPKLTVMEKVDIRHRQLTKTFPIYVFIEVFYFYEMFENDGISFITKIIILLAIIFGINLLVLVDYNNYTSKKIKGY